MCGFIAQLVEQRTGNAEVTGSNPVEALIFFRLLLSNCLNWKISCDDHSSLSLLFLFLLLLLLLLFSFSFFFFFVSLSYCLNQPGRILKHCCAKCSLKDKALYVFTIKNRRLFATEPLVAQLLEHPNQNSEGRKFDSHLELGIFF